MFYGSVRAPDGVAGEKARMTLLFTGPKKWGIAPATVELPVLARAGPKSP
jgi:hypothetical protein